MADENQNCRIKSEEKESMENRHRKRKSRWDERPHISEALMKPSTGYTWYMPLDPDREEVFQRRYQDRLKRIDDDKEMTAVWFLGKMWDEDAVPEFLQELGVEELDPEIRALNCQLIALEKQLLASDCNALADAKPTDKPMVDVVDKMLKKTSQFSDLNSTLTRAIAVKVVVALITDCTMCRFWLRRCSLGICDRINPYEDFAANQEQLR